VYSILDGQTCQLDYARAGHEAPILVDTYGKVVHIGHRIGHPLGKLPDASVDEQTITLAPGGIVNLTRFCATAAPKVGTMPAERREENV